MDFAAFRKQNKADACCKKPTDGEPANSKPAGENETEHQNKDLLDMKSLKSVWVPKKPLVKGLKEENTHHKVKVHFGDHSEIRYVDDNELNVLRKSKRVKKVTHLGRMADGKLLDN